MKKIFMTAAVVAVALPFVAEGMDPSSIAVNEERYEVTLSQELLGASQSQVQETSSSTNLAGIGTAMVRRDQKGFFFPRSLLSAEGGVVQVKQMRQNSVASARSPLISRVCFPSSFTGSPMLRMCIPSSMEVLCENCFCNCHCLIFVAFEAGSRILRMNKGAFWVCSSLSSICIPSSVETISEGCFSGCSSLSTATFERDSPLSLWKAIYGGCFSRCSSLLLTKPDFRPLQIAADAFCGFSSLSSICIPFSVETIGEWCFSGCRGLSTVTFESGSRILRIQAYAFSDCSSLSSICILSSVETIGRWCFSECSSLSMLTFESSSKLSRIESSAFGACSSLSSICIPSSMEVLCEGCFYNCSSLSTVTFESDSRLSRIEGYAFRGCNLLSSICIPRSVEALCEDCFGSCKALREVTFESNSKLLQIESRAFNECSSLPSICIPSSVKILYARCFDQCSSLSNVTFGPSSRLSQIEEGNSDGSDAGHISPTEKNLRKKCFNRCPNPIFHNLPRIEAQNPS